MKDKSTIEEMPDWTGNEEIEDVKVFEKKIQKGIRRNIYTRSLIMILAAALVFTGVKRIWLYEQERSSWHLSDLEQLIDPEPYGEYAAEENAFLYISAYYDMFVPGYAAVKRSYPAFAERIDYGIYEFRISMINCFRSNPEGISGYRGSDSCIVIDHGKLIKSGDIAELEMQDQYTAWWSMGSERYVSFFHVPDPEEEIRELPPSAYVEMDIRLKDPVSIEELLKIQADHPDSRILYAVTYADDDIVSEDYVIANTCGFSLMGPGLDVPLSTEAMEKYPYLAKESEFGREIFAGSEKYLQSLLNENTRKMYAEKYLEHYLSVLNLFHNNPVLDLQYPEKEIAEKALADAQENSVRVIGLRMSLTKEDAFKIMEKEFTESVHIADVKMSRFDR